MTTIVVLIVLGLGLRLGLPHMGSSVAGGIVTDNQQQALSVCPDTPNCQRDTLPIEADPAAAIATMAALVAEQPGTRIVTQTEEYLHTTWTSRVMGFVDDVEFLLTQDSQDNEPVLQVRSASRLGKSDLGANAKRIESLRSMSRGRL